MSLHGIVLVILPRSLFLHKLLHLHHFCACLVLMELLAIKHIPNKIGKKAAMKPNLTIDKFLTFLKDLAQ